MIWVLAATLVTLGGFCVVLYKGQQKQQLRHDAHVDRLVRQITRTNPSDATLKAVKLTSEVLTDAVDKVTGTIGSSFAAATGLGPSDGKGTIIDPPDPEDDDADVRMMFPDVEFDGHFVGADIPFGNGSISPPVVEQ